MQFNNTILLAGVAPAAIVSFFVVASAFERIPLPNPYVNNQYGFSIAYREGWKSSEPNEEISHLSPGTVHVATFYPGLTNTSEARMLIHVHSLQGRDYQSYYEERESFILGSENASKLTSEKWNGVGNNGQTSEYLFLNLEDGEPRHLKRYETVSEDHVYVITFTAMPINYAKYQADFEKSVESFRILE